MNVGVDVTISEFLPEFTPKFLLSEVILAVNSKQGSVGYFVFGCGRQRGNNIFPAFIMYLSRKHIQEDS